jgi:hypothetical protein
MCGSLPPLTVGSDTQRVSRTKRPSAGEISSWPSSPASSFSWLFEWISPWKRQPSSPSEQLAKPLTSCSPSWPSLSPRARFFGLASSFLLRGFPSRRLPRSLYNLLGTTPLGSALRRGFANRANGFLYRRCFRRSRFANALRNRLDSGFSQRACRRSDQISDLFAYRRS